MRVDVAGAHAPLDGVLICLECWNKITDEVKELNLALNDFARDVQP
jgi:hypothetical protein